MVDSEEIKGGKFFRVGSEKCFAIGSRDVYQSDFYKISVFEGVKRILFYFVRFHDVDFSIFRDSGVEQFTFLHGNFSSRELEQICNIPSVRVIQLLDTLVERDDLDEAIKKFTTISFK